MTHYSSENKNQEKREWIDFYYFISWFNFNRSFVFGIAKHLRTSIVADTI